MFDPDAVTQIAKLAREYETAKRRIAELEAEVARSHNSEQVGDEVIASLSTRLVEANRRVEQLEHENDELRESLAWARIIRDERGY